MSTAPPSPPQVPAPPPATRTSSQPPKEITILSHSGLFYWWPVWAIGFILGGLSWFDGNSMYILPSGTTAHHGISLNYTEEVKKDGNTSDAPFTLSNRDFLLLPEKFSPAIVPLSDPGNPKSPPKPVARHVTHSASFGVIFATVLMLVIVITNVPLRGMWSWLVITTTIMLIVIISLIPEGWATLFEWFSPLDIRINAGGYFFISTVLCLIWCLSVFMFDRQTYMTISAGMVKVCTAIGDGEKVYDTTGLHYEKEKSDFFRHFVLGLGSGDLIFKMAGAQAGQFEMQNVLWVSSRLTQIERLTKARPVVAKS